jgi:hypothetical protein
MLAIPLAQVPNQQISFNADGVLWTVHVYQAITHMCADVSRSALPTDPAGTSGQVPIIQGVRCFGGIALLQYPYMYEPNLGNFMFDSDADWTNFGASCNLYYLEQSEIGEFVAALEEGTIG